MTKSPFIVYILPIILSVSLGTLVMAEALNEPDRKLNMWQFDSSTNIATQKGSDLVILGLEKTYSTSDSIQFEIKIDDSSFQCGDLYITVFNGDNVITQSGFLKQCFIKNQTIPIDDQYSETITDPGKYQILIEVFDQTYTNSLSYIANITVE